jgi:hypothetical protein
MHGFALLLAASSALGCGQLLGVDEYEVGETPIRNPCAPPLVWTGGTECASPGVARCGFGFAPDHDGGCEPLLGDLVCPDGQGLFAAPSSETCSGLSTCTTPPAGANAYVRDGATNGDGSSGAPFGTIQEGLLALKSQRMSGAIPQLYVEDGDYRVDNRSSSTFPCPFRETAPTRRVW